MQLRIAVVACGLFSLHALGQQHPNPDLKVIDPAAAVPQTAYRSPFENYMPYREQPLASWRELNEEVARAGGHIGIFRGSAHAGAGNQTPTKPPVGQRAATPEKEAAGRPPVRSEPKAAPSGGHSGH